MWPLEHTQVFLRFELVAWFLTRHEPFSNSSEILSRQTQAKKFERKNFEVGLLCSCVQSCDPRGGANIDPRGTLIG